ncbi:MAG TPA: hypothetical protein VI461_01780 [Chitinophagaceae bacterium]|nr:hypothetical protein [Chitinophagaceae bacterium]
MKIIVLSLLLMISAISFGQTDKYKAVAGTKVSLIPPKGFTASKSFSGFQNEDGLSIMVSELPADYTTIVKSFTADALKAKGMTLIDQQTIDFRNAKATLVKVNQKANGTTYLKQILIFGDSSKTVMINGIYPEEFKTFETAIKNSLLSAYYNPDQIDNGENAADFKIDVSGTPFKFTKYLAGSLSYTTDGQIPTKSADKGILVVAGSIGNTAEGDKKQFATARMKMLPRGESIEITETNPISINRLNGYELVGYGKDGTGKKQLVYLAVLFTKTDEYYMVNGSAIENLDSFLANFRKIVKTFKLK